MKRFDLCVSKRTGSLGITLGVVFSWQANMFSVNIYIYLSNCDVVDT